MLILNLISELEFFKDINVGNYIPIYLGLLDTPMMMFEVFPFIFFLSTQLFYNNLLDKNELNIFKYSGLKNSTIIKIISITTVVISLMVVTIYYSFASNLKNLYISLKKDYTLDGKYLAVITKNGLWIRDLIDNKKLIINAEKIEPNRLVNAYISIFDENFKIIENINSLKIDILNKEWILYDNIIYKNNSKENKEIITINTNYNYKIIQNLFSNLSSLSIKELLELKKNYSKLGYSLKEIDTQLLKISFYPIYLLLMVLMSSLIMLNSKRFRNSITKFTLGLFMSVILYYLTNFFLTLGKTEKINLILSVIGPLIILGFIVVFLLKNVNEK